MAPLFLIMFGVLFLVVLLCVGLGHAFFETRQKSQLRQMLHTAETTDFSAQVALIRPADAEDAFARWLRRFPPSVKLESLLQQSLIGWTSGRFLLTTGAAGMAGFAAGWKVAFLQSPLWSAAGFALLAVLAPLLLVLRKRGKTLHAFEEQFPEALDFLSRSMRAGHGFSISLEMLAKDSAEPLASALRRVTHEMQLGSALDVALGKMVILVPLVDVRFFVSTVLLQQETGGNLSEILNKLAFIIRERFQLKGQVKALSAHGRVTGSVLFLMPVAVTLILLVMSPAYLRVLTDDKDGRRLIYGAVSGQVLGYFIIRKIVNIKV